MAATSNNESSISQYALSYVPAPICGDFQGKHIITVEQFRRRDLDILFQAATSIRKRIRTHDRGLTELCAGKVMASLFFEASTRTDMSFQAAMRRLGGDVIAVSNGVRFSSMYKGKTCPILSALPAATLMSSYCATRKSAHHTKLAITLIC